MQVYKIHSDFYFVKDEKGNEFTCKIREILKKQKIDIVVGDYVELNDERDSIVSVLKRKNFLLRPKSSNIDLAVIVASIKEPELDLIQLNRYLAYLKYYNINAVICFNKEDLIKTEFSADLIYKKLGYKTFIISAKENIGLDKIKKEIKAKTVVLVGMSGVGKTTLLNTLTKKDERTNEVSSKTQKGRHTTRHCEITDYNDFKIMDTPGFSNLKFDFLLPNELIDLFDDLKEYKGCCKYSNCLHNNLDNKDCSIVKNIDKIHPSRYESYIVFLNETLEYKERISKKSIKKEDNLKNSGNKTVAKISKKKREESRKSVKQNVQNMGGTRNGTL